MSAALIIPNLRAMERASRVKMAADVLYRDLTGAWNEETEAKARRALSALKEQVATLEATLPPDDMEGQIWADRMASVL